MDKLKEIQKHIMLINDILLKEDKEEQKVEDKVWEVYWLDSAWLLDRDTLRIFRNWEDAYKYYCDLAQNTLGEYRNYNERLKRPTVINDFTPHTYFLDNDYLEFWIDNKSKWNCHIWFEYEETYLEEFFIF